MNNDPKQPCDCKLFCHKDEPKGKYIHGPGVGFCQGLPVRRKPPRMLYRSECNCPCHGPDGRDVMMHVMPCCQPDPEPALAVKTQEGQEP